MNNLYLTILFCFFNSISFSQIWENELLKINPNPTIQEKSIAFEEYRAIHPYTKGNGFKPYAREMDFILERSSGSETFKADALFKEWKKIQDNNSYSETSTQSNWISKGPINTPLMANGNKRGNGRVNCIAFDPVDPDIIWIGSPAGGLWKSVDGGNNWTTNTDGLPVIGVSHIAIDPNDNQIMYIVTGDAYATDTYSIGVLKSTDGGATWNTTGISYNIDQEKTVNKVIINPNNSDSLYAATNSNILISTDAGINWLTVGAIGRWRDIEFKPDNSNVIYAAKQSSGGSNIYRSTDGGGNWVIIDNGISGSRYRPLIAVSPDNPEVIYALFSASDYSFHGLYKSSDSGDNWIMQSNSPNILGRETDGSGSGGQSWYDLSLGVSTNNENLVYIGGINIWRSDNGGVNWDIDASSGSNQQLYSYMHVDQHAFEFNPHTHVAYAGNDGGFYKYMGNLNKWVDISDGLEISQFYNLGLSQSNHNRIVAGAQDNGTEMLTNSTWEAIMGGDGMECKIDHYDDEIIYAEYQYGGIRKTNNGGSNWNNIKPVSYEGGWNTPYEMHSSNNNLIVIGYEEVYRSETAGAIWDSISYNVSGGQALKSIALAPSNENYIYAATYSSIKVTKDAGATWVNIKPGIPNYNITDVTVANNNPDRVWITLSQYNSSHKIYESTDGGTNWINITATGLPNLPVNCIVYQHSTNDDLYVGTDVGVFYKNNTMTDWIPFMNGLPNVIVKELEIHYTEGTISAATFGRGVWKSTLNIQPLSISENNIKYFDIYPNPATEQITINIASDIINNLTATIYSITGQSILEKEVSSTSTVINTNNLAKGYYILQLSNKKGGSVSIRKKLIIK